MSFNWNKSFNISYNKGLYWGTGYLLCKVISTCTGAGNVGSKTYLFFQGFPICTTYSAESRARGDQTPNMFVHSALSEVPDIAG